MKSRLSSRFNIVAFLTDKQKEELGKEKRITISSPITYHSISADKLIKEGERITLVKKNGKIITIMGD